jgi:hypothetical protein
MKLTNMFFIILMSYGCATSTQTVMPDGKQGYSIDCSGSAVSMNKCYEKAASVCPLGYVIHTKDESGGWLATNSFAGSTSLKGIMVTCRDQQRTNEMLIKNTKGCMNDNDCDDGKVCATVGGDYPGSCAKPGLGL